MNYKHNKPTSTGVLGFHFKIFFFFISLDRETRCALEHWESSGTNNFMNVPIICKLCVGK